MQLVLLRKYPVHLILAAYTLTLVLLFALLFAMRLPVELLGVMVVPAILAAVLYPRRVYITMAVLLILHTIVGIAWLAPDPRTSYIGLVIFTVAWSIVAEILRALVAMQRRTETKLRESEERYRLLVENQGEGVTIVDPQENFVFANPAAEEIFGVAPGGLRGKNLRDFATVSQFTFFEEQTRQRLAGEKSSYEATILRPNGEARTLLVTATPYRNAEGQFVGTFGVFRDITERKQSEQALARRDAILNAVTLAAERFLRTSSWRDHIPQVLEHLARATQVSRIAIFENRWEASGTLLWQQRYAWTPAAPSPIVHILEERTLEPVAQGLERWVHALERGKWIHGNVRDFPPNEQTVLTAQGVRSVVLVPIFVQATWWGVMELDDGQHERQWSSAEIDALVTACDILGAAIGREWIDTELRTRAHYLELVNRITDAAIAAPNLSQMLQTIARHLSELWNADGCYLRVFDVATPTHCYQAAAGMLNALEHTANPSLEALVREVAQRGSVCTASDLMTPEVFHLLKYPVRSLVGLPLIARGERLGAALIAFRHLRYLTREEMERGEQAARHLALAIARAYALELERQRATELETIHSVGLSLTQSLDLGNVLDNILMGVFRLSPDAQDAHIYFYRNDRLEFAASLWEDGRKNYEFSSPRPHGLTNTVARHGEMIVIHDAATHPLFASSPHAGAIIGLPLKIGTRVVGVMNVAYRTSRHFSRSELRALELLASQAAIAIENARLFDETRQRAERMNVLNEIGRALTATLQLPELYRIIQQQTQRILTTDAFFIALYDEHYQLVHFPFVYDDGTEYPGFQVPLPTTGPLSYVIRTRAPYLVNRATNHVFKGGTHFGSPEKKTAAAIYVPMMLGTRILGVMSTQSYRENSYQQDDVQLFQTIAAQAAIALQNARLYNEVQQLATMDELTGVFNRRGLFQLAEREVDRALRYQRSLAVMMLDIDCFKAVNDIYGHLVGDRILRAVVERCREYLRVFDLIGRYGGEEFLLVLPETNDAEALGVAERLRRTIEQMRVPVGENEIAVTVSLGVAVMTPAITNLTMLIERADHALYLAKQAGRNCVRQYNESL